MLERVIAGAVPRIAEQRRRRIRAAERRVVAHIDPGSARVGLALGQNRHRRVVAVQALRRQHMVRDQIVQRPERHRAGPDLVGQRRQAEIDAFAGVAVALAVQRLVLAVLLEHDRRQQVGARPAPGRCVERRRRLRYLLARPAGELLAHRLDHLPAARDNLQRLGHVLADLRQLLRTAARARCRRRNNHPLARQVRGKRLAARTAAGEPLHLRGVGRGTLGRQLVLRRARLELVELEFKLIQQALFALRALPVQLPPELLDRQLQEGDLRRGVGHLRLCVYSPRLGRHEGRLQRCNVGSAGHRRQRITAPNSALQQSLRPHRSTADQPARDGRQVRTGLRQSIPSSR